MWANLLLKLPFLSKLGSFLTSGRFLAFIGAVIIFTFLFTQATSFIGNYVDREVNQRVDISMSHNKISDLENQVNVLKRNQKIVAEVTKETRVIQQQQQQKSDKIEEKINEQVKEGNDSYSPSITSTVIDSL